MNSLPIEAGTTLTETALNEKALSETALNETSQTDTNLIDSKRKKSTPFLYVVVVALFPITLPAIIALVVVTTLYIQSIGVIGAETRYATITNPAPGDKVPERFNAQGTIKERPTDTYTFVSGTTGGLYWPKIGVTGNNWNVDLSAPGALGYKFDLVVIAVSAEDKARIEEWFQNGIATGKYPGLQGFNHLQTLAKVRIER